MEMLDQLNPTYWLLQTVAMLLTAFLIPNLRITGPLSALIAVLALAFVNAHLWDAALFFQIPDSLTIHAAALFVSNGIIFWLLVKLLPGIEVDGIAAALFAPIVFTLCSLLISKYGMLIDWPWVWDQIKTNVESVRRFVQDNAPPPQSTALPGKAP